jgi:hypothetical protein
MSDLPKPAVIDTYELGALLTYATRYALGRKTYAVNDVCCSLRKYWGNLREADRTIIRRDVLEEVRRHRPDAAAGCDLDDWRSILELP